MTEHGRDDELGGYEPSIMRRMARANQRWSTPWGRLLYAVLFPIGLSWYLASAVTSSTNRALNVFVAITFAWNGVTLWLRRRKPDASTRPPAYMTWTAQRWWIGSALIGGLGTVLVATVAYAHRPLDQAVVLIVGSLIGTGSMQLVRSIARRRYAG